MKYKSGIITVEDPRPDQNVFGLILNTTLLVLTYLYNNRHIKAPNKRSKKQ
jgi:hypothetical protein